MSKTIASKLDWNHLLGFEQIVGDRSMMRVQHLGNKVGNKTGEKPVGIQIGAKIGGKEGSKPAG